MKKYKPTTEGVLGSYIPLYTGAIVITLYMLTVSVTASVISFVVLMSGVTGYMFLFIRRTEYSIGTEKAWRESTGLTHEKAEVPIAKIQNTEVKQTVFHKYLSDDENKYGTVHISSAGSSGTDVSLTGVRDVRSIEETIIKEMKTNTLQDSTAQSTNNTDNPPVLLEAKKLRQTAEKLNNSVMTGDTNVS
jgi:uncharacterized membrane protein YdbT with pleckstrin-like domain